MDPWPSDPDTLAALQRALAREQPVPWRWPGATGRVGGCAVVFERGAPDDQGGDRAWAAAVVLEGTAVTGRAVRAGIAPVPFVPGLLAAREGPLLEAVVRDLAVWPDVLIVHAAGRDHPRRAGLALHLGWVLAVPTVGVTEHPLLARGGAPGDAPRASAGLELGGEPVGYLVRTRGGALPVAAHGGWRTSAEVARDVVLASSTAARMPEPIRAALALARAARSRDGRAAPPTREA